MFHHDRCAYRALFSIPVALTLVAYAGLYYCYLRSFMLQVAPTPALVGVYILLHASLVLGLVSYGRSVVTDPGGVAESLVVSVPFEDEEKEDSSKYLESDLLLTSLSQCQKCNKLRPPRAHHCQICGRCIQRMDHHCPWIANCVGLYNHKYFALFIWYTTLCAGISAVCCGYRFLTVDDPELDVCLTISAVVSVSMFLVLLGLGSFHFWLLVTNHSTIEYKKIEDYNVFDQGWKENLRQVCGEDWRLWCLPLNGLSPREMITYPSKPREKDIIV